MRPDRDRLGDILENLMASGLLRAWVVYRLQVIGEAAHSLSHGLVAARPEIPWRKIAGLRHAIVHRYIGIDLAIVRRLVVGDLPVLERSVQAILSELPP